MGMTPLEIMLPPARGRTRSDMEAPEFQHMESLPPQWLRRYSSAVARRPRAAAGLWATVCFAVCLLGSLHGPVIETDNPEKGFIPFGTPLVNQISAYELGLQHEECYGRVTSFADGTPSSAVWFWGDDDHTGDCSIHKRSKERRRLFASPSSPQRWREGSGWPWAVPEGPADDDAPDAADTHGHAPGTGPGPVRADDDKDDDDGHRGGGKLRSDDDHNDDTDESSPPTSSPTPIPGTPRYFVDDLPVCQYGITKANNAEIDLVLKPVADAVSSDMLAAEALVGMCGVAARVAAFDHSDRFCYKVWDPHHGHLVSESEKPELAAGAPCCMPRTLGHYAAARANKTACADVDAADAAAFRGLLDRCAPSYLDGSLEQCGFDPGDFFHAWSADRCPPSVPRECVGTHVPYDVYDALFTLLASSPTEAAAAATGSPPSPTRRTAQVLIPVKWNHEYMDALEARLLNPAGSGPGDFGGFAGAGAVRVVAFGLHTKMVDFTDRLVAATAYALVAFLLVFLLMWLHTSSLFLSGFAFLQILASLGVSYALYACFFDFFPFLNLVAIFIVIGIGADDVFVLVDHWKASFARLPQATPLDARLAWTLQHAGGAMLVTSLTTSAAFFANLLSPITSVKLFGVYCGMVVMVDFLLMVVSFAAA